MKRSRVSISDIARELGVSPSTISRALSDHNSISEKTKQLVRECVERMDYVPNHGAANLKSGKNKIIGVVVPIIGRNFFASAIEGIEDYAHSKGYDVIICQSKDSADTETKIIHSLRGKVDGIIASLAAEEYDHKCFDVLHKINMPLVLFDRVNKDISGASTIEVDDFKGAKMAVKHLLDCGFKHIEHFAGVQNVSVWKNRQEGYLSAMREAGIEPKEEWMHISKTTKDEGALYAQQLLSSGRKLPDAIFFSGDYAALGAMTVFKQNGVKIPEDIAIVGFANEMFCEVINPSLTSVNQFSLAMGSEACRILFDMLDGGAVQNEVIEPELIIRESSVR